MTLQNEIPRSRSLGALLGFGAATILAGVISGAVNRKPKNQLWYRALRKPAMTPPPFVFALVWPALYASAAWSTWRVWKTPSSSARTTALTLWGAQLACNVAWSPIFFGAHRPRLALADLGANVVTLGAYAAAASRVDREAGALVAPYLGWLGFAGVMNAGIITNNRGTLRHLLQRG